MFAKFVLRAGRMASPPARGLKPWEMQEVHNEVGIIGSFATKVRIDAEEKFPADAGSLGDSRLSLAGNHEF
jgi:hypothetical protein